MASRSDPTRSVIPDAAPRGGLWTPRRVDLLAALERLDGTAAGLYRRAVDGLAERPWSADGLTLVSTCVRELVNRLPGYLGETVVAGFRSERRAIQVLERELSRAGLDGPNESPATEEPASSHDDLDPSRSSGVSGAAPEEDWVPVPRGVLAAARDVATVSREAATRSRDLRSALVGGAKPDRGTESIVRLLSEAINAFEKRRHPRGDVSTWAVDGPEIYVQHWAVIEQVLEGRIGRFFDVVADLQNLLELANVITDGEWSVPTDEQVAQAMARLADLQHRRVFYDGLQNPLWIGPLERRRAFDDPPHRLMNDTRRLPYQHWPQGDYLYRMGAHDPHGVASILARVVTGDAAWNVYELVVRIASELPSDATLLLLGHVEAVAEDPTVGEYRGIEMIQVVETLAAGGHRKPARKLAELLLRPRQADGPATTRRTRGIDAGIDTHWYDEALGRVVGAFGNDLDVFTATVWWLDEHQTLSGAYDPEHNYDRSRMRRPSLDSRGRHSLMDEIGEPLIDTVRDLAIQLIGQVGPAPVVSRLRKRPASILRRIELYALAKTLTTHPEVLAIAVEHIVGPRQEDALAGGREHNQLARALLPTVDTGTYEAWADTIFAGPNLDAGARSRIASFRGGASEDAVQAVIERWQLDQLHSVGTDVLRGQALALYQALVERHGDPDDNAATGESDERFIAAQVDGLTAAQVLDLVEKRVEAGDLKTSDRAYDLGTVVTTAVAERVAEFSQLAPRVLEMEPAVVQHYLRAFTQHVNDKEGSEPAGEAQTDVVRDAPAAAEVADASQTVAWEVLLSALLATDVWHETPDEAYGGWRWVRSEICSLLEAAAESDLPGRLIPDAVELARLIVSDSDPTPSTESRFGGSNMDPLTHSLNTVRPSAVRTLMRLGRAAETRRCERTSPPMDVAAIRVQTLTVLNGLLRPQRDHSLTIAAVLGENLGWLIGNEPEWLALHASELCSSDAFGDVFISTAMALHHPHTLIIEFLTPAIDERLYRVESGAELTSGMRHDRTPMELIGDHLVVLYTWGRLGLDDPLLRRFFATAPIRDRASVLKHLAWRYFHTTDLEVEVRNRAAQLWDNRLAAVEVGDTESVELADFEWWIRCGAFHSTWWLPRLIRLAESHSFSGRLHIGDQLDSASETDPAQTLHALDLLVRKQRASHRLLPYGIHEAAPVIVARALDSNDPTSQQRADDLIDFVGRNGLLSFPADVERHRSPNSADPAAGEA